MPSILKKALKLVFTDDDNTGLVSILKKKNRRAEIGRASCRERV